MRSWRPLKTSSFEWWPSVVGGHGWQATNPFLCFAQNPFQAHACFQFFMLFCFAFGRWIFSGVVCANVLHLDWLFLVCRCAVCRKGDYVSYFLLSLDCRVVSWLCQLTSLWVFVWCQRPKRWGRPNVKQTTNPQRNSCMGRFTSYCPCRRLPQHSMNRKWDVQKHWGWNCCLWTEGLKLGVLAFLDVRF